ncbi:MAG: hypothetical protein M1827_005301 [Pycnora praestabilis]|nr:MAG: hypothetical protein M1827_005301 [Pycnora praestabilis]
MSAQIPGTPQVISPTPTESEGSESKDGYFAPITRPAAKSGSKKPVTSPIDEENEAEDESDSSLERRARSRSRSPILEGRRRRMSGLAAINPKSGMPSAAASKPAKKKPEPISSNGKATNGHLSPSSASSSYWRDFSRSPSPLGLIPIHRHWRSFVHRHEIPRKVLHVSIGFFTIYLYTRGVQSSSIAPYLLGAFIPIASTDLIRHNWPAFNRFYIRCLGAFMRETEVDGYNGVIWYLLGAWIVIRWFPKDIATMGVLLLSWCDTAASTFGRMYGRYTPRIRKGKSLAGSLAACAVGVITAAAFWGWLVPKTGPFPDDPPNSFMFTGQLSLPSPVKAYLGIEQVEGVLSGGLALGIMSLWAGVAASASEVVDLFGWDDNLTIPVLSGLGLWGFLKVFG